MCGYLAFSWRSWLKLPRSGWSQVSATPLDGLVGGVGLVVGGVGVADGALAVLDVAEGVVDVRDLRGGAGGHQVLDVVVAAVDAPLGEVAELDLAAVGPGSVAPPVVRTAPAPLTGPVWSAVSRAWTV